MSRFGSSSRASEVEKAELTLESTRRNLEACQQEVKTRDRELARQQEKYDDVCKELDNSKTRITELERKIEDLKLQVRHELMKNENIEKGLETIPRLKDDIQERDKKIHNLQKELDERSALLNSSRKSAREYRDRIRDLERTEEETLSMREELEVAQSEVNTLKKLMSGKDALVLHKCHALDQAKLTVETLRMSSNSEEEKVRLKRIQHVLEQLKHLHMASAGGENKDGSKERPVLHNRFAQSRPRSAMGDRNIDVNQHPYAAESGHNKENDHSPPREEDNTATNQKSNTYIFLERFLNDTEGINSTSRHGRAKTAAPSNSRSGGPSGGGRTVVQRSASFHNGKQKNESGGVRSQYKAVSSHNVSNGRPQTSSTSPRTKQSGATTTMYLNAAGQCGSAGNLYTSENSHKLNSKYQPSLEYALGVSTDEELTTDTSHCLSGRQRSNSPPGRSSAYSRPRSSYPPSKLAYNHSTGSDTETSSHENVSFADIVGSRLTNQQLATLSRLSAGQKDAILSDVIQNGDRVTITVTQKPPRYGRKKPKPIIYTGIVKYKGHLDKDHYDARIYVGLRLDAPMGETDGTYKGKRYMFTPPDHAKFFKIRDLDAVLDVPSGMYIPTSKLILRHQEIHQRQQHSNTTNSNDYTVTTEGDAYHNNNNNHNNSTSAMAITALPWEGNLDKMASV